MAEEIKGTLTVTRVVFRDNHAEQFICEKCLEMLYEFFFREEVKIDGETREAYNCPNCGRGPGDD